MKKLEALLNQIEQHIPFQATERKSVSQVSAGWHLEHSMLVLNGVVRTIEASNPSEYKFQWKPIRFVIMTFKNIPRGKGRAPSRVQPTVEFNEASLREHLAKTREAIQKLNGLGKNQFFPHPYFGNMKLKSAIKFLGIHTTHHLNIVRDIVKE